MWSKMVWPLGDMGRTLVPNSYILAAALVVGTLVIWAARERVSPRLAEPSVLLTLSRTVYFATLFAVVFVTLDARAQFIYFQF